MMNWNSIPFLFMLACLADVLLSDSSGGIGLGNGRVGVSLTPPLIQHILDNDLGAAYDLIALGDSPNVKESPSGWTPLIYAASAGDTDLAQHLLLAGADVNMGCVDGWSPLMFASVHGRLPMMKLLMAHSANIHQVSSNGATALGCAKLGGFSAAISLVEETLQTDRLTEIFCDKQGVEAVILTAAHTSDEALVRHLLEDGHSANTISSGGWTPLQLAAAAGCAPCLQLLISHGAQVDYQDNDGWTALMFSAHSGHVAGVRILVAASSDVLLTNFHHFNALHLARAEGHDEAFHTMVAGSFCSELREGHVARMMLMVEDGVDPNYVCAQLANYTPLIVAVKAQDEAVVRELLADERVNVNAVEQDHWSSLMFASLRSSDIIVRLLLEHGADRDLLTSQGYSVIRLAQMYSHGNNDVILGMLENGLDFTDSPSVYLETEKERKESYNKNVEVDAIIKSVDTDDTRMSGKRWTSIFHDRKKGEVGDGEPIRPYLHSAPSYDQGSKGGAKNNKNLLTSLFAWL